MPVQHLDHTLFCLLPCTGFQVTLRSDGSASGQSVASITKAIGDSPLQLSPRQDGAEVIVPVPK